MQNTQKPALHKAIITQKNWVSSRVLEITLSPLTSFTFTAGHFINLQITNPDNQSTESVYRAYSIASDPAKSPEFKIIVAAQHSGAGSNFLKNVSINTEISFIGPSGRFFMQKPPASNILFLATGTGVAPLISFLYDMAQNPLQYNQLGIKLYHGLRDPSEIFYIDILESFKKQLNFKYTICLSSPDIKQNTPINQTIDVKQGRLTNHYTIDDAKDTHVYLCGHPDMIADNIKNLSTQGVPDHNIFYEGFTKAVVAIR
jgi:ferredoxin-NADP reductase